MAYARVYSQHGQQSNIDPSATNSHGSMIANNEADNIDTIPERVQDYVDLYPIKRPTPIGSRFQLSTPNIYGYVTSTYRATNLNTNQPVCLRRIHSFQPGVSYSKSTYATIEGWKKIHCANIVRLLHVFTTKDFGDTSLVLVYQYFPQMITFTQQYFNDPQSMGGGSMYGFGATNRPYSQQIALLKVRLLPENLIWHFIIQISSAIRLIHSQGLACRIIDPSKIVITSSMPKCPPSQLQPSRYPRIRLNSCGLFDLVTWEQMMQEHGSNIKGCYQQLQQADLVSFGQLCLSLATCSLANSRPEQWEQALDMVTRTYSSDLKALLVMLLSTKQQGQKPKNINDIMPLIGARFYVQLNQSYELHDYTQSELEIEALNGKLFRLLVKLSMINDRPELRIDPSWSETGDRYMLKLFREYLFHQVSEDGSPWLDMGHVISTLIKFDTGSPEKICLISRNEQHVLIVSFAELKKCFESSFRELQP